MVDWHWQLGFMGSPNLFVASCAVFLASGFGAYSGNRGSGHQGCRCRSRPHDLEVSRSQGRGSPHRGPVAVFELSLENFVANILILLGVLLGAFIVGALSYLRHGWTTLPHTRLPYPLLDGLIALAVLGILVITLWPPSGLGGTRVHPLPLSDSGPRTPYRTSLIPGILAAMPNFLLFIPLGFLVGIRWRTFDRWSTVLPLGIGLSLGIEILQFRLGGHDSSFDDVFLNALGAVCGYALLKTLRRKSRRA
jgi:VanZ family protein